MASRTPIEMLVLYFICFSRYVKKKHKKSPNVFFIEFFFNISTLDRRLGKYMNPYDVRKLTSRNLTYF